MKTPTSRRRTLTALLAASLLPATATAAPSKKGPVIRDVTVGFIQTSLSDDGLCEVTTLFEIFVDQTTLNKKVTSSVNGSLTVYAFPAEGAEEREVPCDIDFRLNFTGPFFGTPDRVKFSGLAGSVEGDFELQIQGDSPRVISVDAAWKPTGKVETFIDRAEGYKFQYATVKGTARIEGGVPEYPDVPERYLKSDPFGSISQIATPL
jgi:hypothetical protein